jgi:DNA-binding CsgD family transcriptional regulator/tetratricopeptide (TPR) repeat protein
MKAVPLRVQTMPDAAFELLERSEQFTALADALESVARRSCGRLVFVGGEAGVGKTALLRRFCDEENGSTRILWGACDPLFTPRPLGPFLDIAQTTGGELETVASESKPYEVAAALLRELGTRTPTILDVEDVHWADEATLDILRLLARRVESIPALVLVSYRDDELDRAHPLRLVLGDGATNQAVDRLRLTPLSPDAVATLAEPHGVDADELYETTGGNPFFVTEVLASGSGDVPHTVRDAVLARIARLSGPALALLEAVAVVPPQAEFWLLETLAGEALGHLDECVTSGMLSSGTDRVEFRHELARLAVEESLPTNRRIALHREALTALADPPVGVPDLARLAHHAEAAGDVDAVLRFAPAAAARAASLGAHREAAAQYARALRFSDGAPPEERADLLDRRSLECFLTDQYDEAIDALERAIEYHRKLGNRRKEGDSLRALSRTLWCPGRTAESEDAARGAVAVLERLPPGRELAMAYSHLAAFYKDAEKRIEAVSWGGRALDLAERLGDTEILVHAVNTVGTIEFLAGKAQGREKVEQSLELAEQEGLEEQVARAFMHLVGPALRQRLYAHANRYLDAGLMYCSERGLELHRLYLLGYRARSELDQGRWTEAVEFARLVLRIPRTSTIPRINALVVLGLVRARRGDPDAVGPLAEAWALAEPTGELQRLGPAAAARAEVAWLAGDADAVASATEAVLELALQREAPWLIGELAYWRRRAGLHEEIPAGAAEPYALQMAGKWERAAERWTEIGCPYEAALALAHGDEAALRRAHAELQRLGAVPAATIVAQRLRALGARGVPRGPRASTQNNPANLTERELEVLELVSEGLRNVDIADRLFLSRKTVDHHVSAILRKLGVSTRGQAGAEAVRLGLAGQDR